MKSSNQIVVEGRSFASRSEAARHYGLEPKLVNERVSKLEWSLEEALGLVVRDCKLKSKTVVVDDVEYSSIRQAAKAHGIKQSTLMNRLSSGLTIQDALSSYGERERLTLQEKPIFYREKLYISARYMLNANSVLIDERGLSKQVTSINDKARLAKKKGKIQYLSLKEASEQFGLSHISFADEFDVWTHELMKKVGATRLKELFYQFD